MFGAAVPMASAAPVAPAEPHGVYTAVDVVDGSNMVLMVLGGPSPFVILYDHGGSVCGPGANEELIPVLGVARGARDGETVHADLRLLCFARPLFSPGVFSMDFTATGAGEVTDSTGQVWTK
jgi:hypothetical protein